MTIYYLLTGSDQPDEQAKTIDVRQQENLFRVSIGEQSRDYDVHPLSAHQFSLLHAGKSYLATLTPGKEKIVVELGFERYEICLVNQKVFKHRSILPQKKEGSLVQIKSPMPGKIVTVLVKSDQDVVQGQGLIVVEAMKMENEVRAPMNGKIRQILVQPGETVDTSKVLMTVA